MADKTDSSAIVALAGLIAAAIVVYLWYSSKPSSSGPGDDFDGPTPPVPDDPEIPGSPQFWNLLAEANPPAKNLSVTWPGGPVHFTMMTGYVEIINSNPGAWFKAPIGYTIYAVKTGGQKYAIYVKHPAGGVRAGVYPFSATVGLDDIAYLWVEIDRLYYTGDHVYRIKSLEGEATIFK